jgi:hypothetical protein
MEVGFHCVRAKKRKSLILKPSMRRVRQALPLRFGHESLHSVCPLVLSRILGRGGALQSPLIDFELFLFPL